MMLDTVNGLTKLQRLLKWSEFLWLGLKQDLDLNKRINLLHREKKIENLLQS